MKDIISKELIDSFIIACRKEYKQVYNSGAIDKEKGSNALLSKAIIKIVADRFCGSNNPYIKNIKN